MKILLVGEYSRLHNSLKEGLQQLENEVVILGFNDGFKNFPVDYLITKKWDSGILKKIKIITYKTTGFDISSYLTYRQFKKKQTEFKGFDVVQLINENSFYCNYHYEKKILSYLFKNNKKTFLLSCGDDFTNVNYYFNNKEIKSFITPYFEGKIRYNDFLNVLKFTKKQYQKLHQFIQEHCNGIIASDIDYHIPLQNHPNYLGLLPNPINVDTIAFSELKIEDKIILFHGINRENYYKKGNDYFEKAVTILQKKYPEKIEVFTTEDLPYCEYIEKYNKAHIILDQVYAYDQGYNALEAMAKGKVVVTGGGKEFEKHYNLNEKVAVNAFPDVDYLVETLSLLIENPKELSAIGTRARKFVEEEHHYIKIAKRYLEVWKNN